MRSLHLLVLLTLGFSIHSEAKEDLQTGTSVSHFYEARSVFINPAALSFQRELNGGGIVSSLSWGLRERNDDFALALGWGSLGFGVESLSTTNLEYFNRYSFANSLALSPWLFLGSRLSLSTASPSLEGITQLDLGLQIRPSSVFSIGVLVNRLNRPNQNGVNLDSQYAIGLTLRPFDKLTLLADLGKDRSYQGTASYEILRGLYVQAGYDKTNQTHFGFQFNLGTSSLFSMARPNKSAQVLVSHAQFAPFQKPTLIPTHDALHVKIDSSLREAGEVETFFSPGQESFSETLIKIRNAGNQSDTKAIFVELDSFPLGMGAAQELFETLWNVREQGKVIHVSLGNARLKEYLIASAAHSISISPSGSIEWIGPKSERYYLKGTLDKAGVKAEIVAKGAYKSAPETFTELKASEKSRENIFQNLEDAGLEIRNCIQRSGRVNESLWSEAKTLGILSARTAKELKLVDHLQDPRQYREQHLKNLNLGEDLEQVQQDLSLPSKIALIIATGDIVREKMKLIGFLGGSQITPKQISDQIAQIKNDATIKAVVVRVSSGGGDVLASHLIANQIKELAKSRPVIVSMGDVAASGGYFISAPSHAIYASPLSLTGSIGVFTGKPNLSGLYKKLDLRKEILTQTPYPGLFTESTEWSKAELDIIQRQVSDYYQTFLQFVSENRGIPLEKVDGLAQGRTWMGKRATDGKLIDGLGGLSAALDEARRRAGISKFSIKVVYPSSKFLDSLNDLFFVKQSSIIQEQVVDASLFEGLRPGLISDQPFLYWSGDSIL